MSLGGFHGTSLELTYYRAYSLTSGAFLLFFGRFADLFGRRWLFLSSLFAFSVIALITSFASSPLFLDSFNGLLGLASAAAVPPAVGTLGATYSRPSKRKNYAFACFSAGNPLGFVFGSIASGAATKLFSWRASYRLLAIIYIVVAVVALFTVPADEGLTRAKFLDKETFKRFDVPGVLLAISGFALFTSSLSLVGDAPDGWKTPYVIALLVVGVILLGTFIYWESIFKAPVMPLHVWKDPTFSLILAVLVLGFLGFSSSQFWLSLYLQRVRHASALDVAVLFLPQAIMGIIVNIIAGLLLHRVSNKILMTIGACSYLVAFTLLGTMPYASVSGADGWNYWAFVFPSLIVTVVGADLEFNVANMYVMSALPKEQQSVAGGIFNTVTKLCSAVGLGITTAVYNGVLEASEQRGEKPIMPYEKTWWVAVACAGLGVLLVPFVKLGTQGGRRKKVDVEKQKVDAHQAGIDDQKEEEEDDTVLERALSGVENGSSGDAAMARTRTSRDRSDL